MFCQKPSAKDMMNNTEQCVSEKLEDCGKI